MNTLSFLKEFLKKGENSPRWASPPNRASSLPYEQPLRRINDRVCKSYWPSLFYLLIQGSKYIFLFDLSFSVLTQISCSSPIAIKDFGGAVGPPFCLAFSWSIPHFRYKELPDLQKKQPFFSISFNIFLWKYRHVLSLCS